MVYLAVLVINTNSIIKLTNNPISVNKILTAYFSVIL